MQYTMLNLVASYLINAVAITSCQKALGSTYIRTSLIPTLVSNVIYLFLVSTPINSTKCEVASLSLLQKDITKLFNSQ